MTIEERIQQVVDKITEYTDKLSKGGLSWKDKKALKRAIKDQKKVLKQLEKEKKKSEKIDYKEEKSENKTEADIVAYNNGFNPVESRWQGGANVLGSVGTATTAIIGATTGLTAAKGLSAASLIKAKGDASSKVIDSKKGNSFSLNGDSQNMIFILIGVVLLLFMKQKK